MMDGGEADSAFQELPYYKAIIKSFFRRQIQHLLEELAEQTGEESIILTADVNNGTLSQLGSNTGKGFLEGRDEIKAQFLSYCLKSHHGQMKPEQQLYQQSFPAQVDNADHMQPPPSKRHRPHPPRMPRLTLHDQTRAPIQRIPESEVSGVSSLDMAKGGNGDLTGISALGNSSASSAGIVPEESTIKTTKKDSSAEKKTEMITVKEEVNNMKDNVFGFQSSSSSSDTLPVSTNSSTVGKDAKSSVEALDNHSDQFSANNVVEGVASIVKVEPGYEDNVDMAAGGMDVMSADLGLAQQGNFPALMGNDPDMFLTQSGRHIGTLSHMSGVSSIQPYMWNQMFSQANTPSQHVQCVLCNKLLSQASFRSHMLSHRGVRNFECEYCHKRFTHKATLLNHRRLHTGERPFKCTVCNIGFPSLSGLSQHKFSRHRNKDLSRAASQSGILHQHPNAGMSDMGTIPNSQFEHSQRPVLPKVEPELDTSQQ